MVTDQEQSPNSKWRYVHDKGLENSSPLYSSFFVRYHPFRYTDADVVVIVDSSIKIKHSLRPIVESFNNDFAQIALMAGNYTHDNDKIRAWIYYNRLSRDDSIKLKQFMTRYDHTESGSLGNAFRMFKRSKIAERYNEHCWRCALALGNGKDPIRLDDVIASTLIDTVYRNEEVFLVDTHILRSFFMAYYRHKNNYRLGALRFYPKLSFRGQPANIHYFDPYCYPTEYSYKSEAILITKYSSPKDLEEWLDWHLNKVKFDHVHIFDNESGYDISSVAKKYGDKVSIYTVVGHPRQYKLYDWYIERQSKAEWIMPIDDDEYLDITDFGSINEAIEYYSKKLDTNMIAVRWKHLFPEKFHSERNGKVLDYCTKEDFKLAEKFSRLGDRGVKTIVRRFGKIHYQETYENPAGGHVPQHGMCNFAKTADGRIVRGCGITGYKPTLEDERIRLLHCRYKGYSEYTRKMKEVVTVSDATPRKKHFKFDDILETLE
jgi:hypothetical protein